MLATFSILLLFSLFTQAVADCSCPEGFENVPEFNLCAGSQEVFGHGWDANRQACENFGGSLVIINNIFYNTILRAIAVQKFTQNSPMIGLHLGVFDNTTWLWVDGSVPTYLHWGAGQPAAGSDCAFLGVNDGLWYGGSCQATNPYLCQLVSTANKCLRGWTYFDETDSCYFLGNGLSFMDAEASCIIQNGHLASIHTKNENDFVQNMTYDGSCSGSFPFKAGSALIGGVFNGTVLSYWTDGSPTDFTYVCNNNPDGDSTSILLRSLPTNCATGCGDGHWMAGYEPIDSTTTYPSFVCKSKPLC